MKILRILPAKAAKSREKKSKILFNGFSLPNPFGKLIESKKQQSTWHLPSTLLIFTHKMFDLTVLKLVQVKAVKVHHLVPCRDEVLDELLF
jgi:hypothetical protein